MRKLNDYPRVQPDEPSLDPPKKKYCFFCMAEIGEDHVSHGLGNFCSTKHLKDYKIDLDQQIERNRP